jgi:hypothetical protein
MRPARFRRVPVAVYTYSPMRWQSDSHFGCPNPNPDGTLITESDCRTCRHFAYLGYIRGALEPSPGCGKRLTGFPDEKLCSYYEREPGSDDE